jgi:hypothetical protein
VGEARVDAPTNAITMNTPAIALIFGETISFLIIVLVESVFLVFLKYLWKRVNQPSKPTYLCASRTLRRLGVLQLGIASVAIATAALLAIARS